MSAELPKSDSSHRRLRRFFSFQSLENTGLEIILTPDETLHLRGTLRLDAGDRCLVADGRGSEGEAVILRFLESGATVLRLETVHRVPLSGIRVAAYPALLQKGKLDDLVEKAQELGLSMLQPLETERTVLKMTVASASRAVARWRKIAREATKQSGSLVLLDVREPLSLESCLKAVPPGEEIVFFHPHAEALPFREWVLKREPLCPCHLFWGPEGGFSEKEIALARAHGARIVLLGETLLKADTAFYGVTAALRFLFP